ncbi:MAG TPA: hypothetical protein VMT81_00970 [Candidatus Paceibacterota bacterium]|nr:hypothetical protein [Candidatus Paceibacterota bacterium]
MTQSSKRLASIVVALLLVAGALVFLFELIQPEYAGMEAIKGKIESEQELLASEQQAVAQAQQLLTQFQNESQSENSVSLAVPNGEDLAGALAQIYGLAANSNITIQSVGISTPVLQAPSAPAGGTAATSIVKPLADIAFTVSATGSYEDLKNFLSGLETNIRILDVAGISINPLSEAAPAAGAKAGSGGSGDLFSYSLNIHAYYQTNPPANS